ncbi:MAG: gamma-glutamyltransferase family protein [Spirochaetota bacterium]
MLSRTGRYLLCSIAAGVIVLGVVIAALGISEAVSGAGADTESGQALHGGESEVERESDEIQRGEGRSEDERVGAAGGRQVRGQHAVSSAHELATAAGLEMLEAGGTAADAAVAVASVLTIVEPWFSSVLGGGTWALYYDAEHDEVTSLDGVGPAPNAISLEAMEGRGGDRGMHQAIVPGAWDGWMLWLDEYGRLELDEVLEPAIEIAEEGYEATPRLIQWLGINRGNHFEQPAFAHGEQMYSEIEELGDMVYQPEQAETFRGILAAYRDSRDEGRREALQAARDYVYRGPIAESIVSYSDEHDGFLALEDFARFEAEIVEPISVEYDDLTMYQNPPNSQGITQLILLKILEGFDLSEYELDDPDAVHLQVEATKLAFADRHYHVGDPEFVDVPVDRLLSEEHIAARREQISMDSVLEWPIDPLFTSAPSDGEDISGTSEYDGHSTTTFHIIDGEGNAAAVTTSLGAQFLAIPGTGVHINSRMTMMHRDPDNPNVIEPGKKVRHTSSPYMVFADGAPYILGGNTGGDTQPQGQAQQFLALHEFGATPEEAVSRPRFLSRGFPSVSYPHSVGNDIRFEDGFDGEIIAELEERGHAIYDGGTGGLEGSAYLLRVDRETGEIQPGADPRDGVGTGEVRRVE